MSNSGELLTLREASEWASQHIGKEVTPSNISYLVQYGRIKKIGNNGSTQILKHDLLDYYNKHVRSREGSWKTQLGDDLNWALSFDQYKEAETTKHVHRLHPYKGKFIPQLVEYFLDDHVDDFKTIACFHKGDIVLDPFAGSGTTLVQACELGLHAVGVDVSAFNALISNSKLTRYDLKDVQVEVQRITRTLQEFIARSGVAAFEKELLQALYDYNNANFPVPAYKYRLRQGEVDEDVYGAEKEKAFLPIYQRLVKKYGIHLRQEKADSFIDKWYTRHIREEIEFVFDQIKSVQNIQTKKLLSVILSRAMRSCRATTHADLATLLEPMTTTYYCAKHGKICKPLFSIMKWWTTYTQDTIKRVAQFSVLRKDTMNICLTGDSKTIDIQDVLEKKFPALAALVRQKKIQGIFSSPPYVGLIDYHEQHAYAYDLFGFQRQDDLEIGPLFRGQGQVARRSYVEGISAVLKNCRHVLVDDFDVFMVANDKYNLYPAIAEGAGMKIVNRFRRPVLNRTEKDKGAYSEIIFHLKDGS